MANRDPDVGLVGGPAQERPKSSDRLRADSTARRQDSSPRDFLLETGEEPPANDDFSSDSGEDEDEEDKIEEEKRIHRKLSASKSKVSCLAFW